MIPPAGSRAYPVSKALATALQAIEGVTVLYLVEGSRETRKDTISVAVGKDAIGIQRVKAPGAAIHYLETMRIVCKIKSRSGSKDPEARMVRCKELFDQVAAVVLADSRLSGTCDMAQMGPDESWSSEDGPEVWVQFSVLTKTNT